MVLKHCQDEADRRVKAGVQWGHIHFKTDRPNTLYVLEPAVDGRRKYLHVGTDPQHQAQRRSAVERGVRLTRLRETIEPLKAAIRELDWEIDDPFTQQGPGAAGVLAGFSER